MPSFRALIIIGRAVGVVGAEIKALIAAHFLEPHPDIGLDILDKVAHVYGAVCVRQG